eukprot:11169655-Karenia_brevis.AAC.1
MLSALMPDLTTHTDPMAASYWSGASVAPDLLAGPHWVKWWSCSSWMAMWTAKYCGPAWLRMPGKASVSSNRFT